MKIGFKNRIDNNHSDREDLQYCSSIYQQILKDNNIESSMGDGYQNASHICISLLIILIKFTI
jgi:hypothetical protein